MRILPILFNTEMVRAILTSLKVATRRIVKGVIPDDAIWGYTEFTPKGYISCRGTFSNGYGEKFFKLPCEKGDILYVREAFCPNYFDKYLAGCRKGMRGNTNAYRADYRKEVVGDAVPEPKWHPSIHMPKEAARIWLKVMDVRVERLCDITEDQAKAEGALKCYEVIRPDEEKPVIYKSKSEDEGGYYVVGFKSVWDSTIQKSNIDSYGWDANPWVWVIEFERCDKPGKEVHNGNS